MAKTSPLRPILKRARNVALAILAFVFLIVVGVRVLAATSIGRDFAENQVETLNIRGQSIDIVGLSGDLFGRLSIDRFTVSDANGVWLRGEDVSLKWSASSLLFQTLSIETLSVNGVTVLRQPTLAPPQKKQSQSAQIKTTRVDAAQIQSLNFADGIFGTASEFSVEVSLNRTAQTGALDFVMLPKSSTKDMLSAELSWSGDVPLEGAASLSAEPGGLLATLLQAPAGAPISATLEADYTQAEWSLRSTARIGDAQALDLQVIRAPGGLSATAEIDAAQLGVTRRIDELLGGPARLDASLNAVSGAEPSALRLMSPDIVFSAVGTLTENSGVYEVSDLVADLTLRNRELLGSASNISFETANFLGMLTYDGGDVRYSGKVSTPAIGFGKRQVFQPVFDGTLTYTTAGLHLDGRINTRAITGTPPHLDSVLSKPATTALSAEYNTADSSLSLSKLEMTATGLRLSGSGDMSGDRTLDLNGKVRIEETAGLAVWGDVEWGINGSMERLTARANGALSPTTRTPILGALAPSTTDFAVELSTMSGQRLILKTLDVRNEVFSLDARATLSADALYVSAQAQSNPLNVSGFELGASTISFETAGPISNLSIDLSGQTSTISRGTQAINDLQISLQSEVDGPNSGELNLVANYLGKQLSLSSEFDLDGGIWSLSGLNAQYPGFELRGDVFGTGTDPKALSAQLEASGTFAGSPSFSGRVGYKDTVLTAELRTEALRTGLLELDTIELVADGKWPDYAASLDARGAFTISGLRSAFSTLTDIRFNPEFSTVEAELDAKIGNEPLSTAQPIQFSYADGIHFDAKLMGFGGHLELQAPLAQTGRISGRIEDIDISLIGPIIARPNLSGRANGQIELSSVDDKIEGRADLDILNLSAGQISEAGSDLRILTTLSEDVLRAEAGFSNTSLELSLKSVLVLPVQSSYRERYLRPLQSEETKLTIIGGGSVAPLWALFSPPDLRIGGDLDVNLEAAGPISQLRLEGPIRFENGVFEDAASGLHLTDVAITADLDPAAINVTSATARGQSGGTLNGAGRYAYDGSGRVSVQLDHLDAFNRPDVSATVSGGIEVGRSRQKTTISGALRLNEARIDLSRLPQQGYTTLDVNFDENISVAEPLEEASPVSLDIDINANRRVFITGAGIDSEWAIDATLNGTPTAPQLSGQARSLRGEASLISRRFELDEGVVRFDGPPEESKVLLRATRTADGITAVISVAGPIMNPEISLTADPQLPEDEVISRVLFGRSPSELSPLQAAQLAAAVAQLAGGGGTFDLTRPLQAAIGLDQLDFGFSDTGGATVSTGKYIARDVYLQIESGASGSPGVIVEWTPLENVEIDARIDPEEGPRVALQWKRDFGQQRQAETPTPEDGD